uniref:Uncharacterized protein n=1 Tax=Anguilla anguilla TaxID=7936 RepID=A0A0E9RX11_ANGAN
MFVTDLGSYTIGQQVWPAIY